MTTLFPPICTSVTVLESPGSNRTAVPAAMSRRLKKAFSRSKERARFVSQKWKCEPTYGGEYGRQCVSLGIPTHDRTLNQTRVREQGTSEAYLDGPISRVGYLEPDPLPPFVDPDRFLADHNRPGDFFIFEPFWFVGPFREHSLGGEGQERAVQGEREVVVDRGGADRVVDRHEKDAVREGAFDLDFVQQERDCLRRESLVESQPNVFSGFDRIADRAEHAVHMTHRLHVNPPENLLPCETGRARCQCRAACASPEGQLWACSSGERNARGRSGIAYRPASSHAIGNGRPWTHSQQLYDAPPLRDRPPRRVQGDIGSPDCPVLIEGLRRAHGAGQRKDTYRWP